MPEFFARREGSESDEDDDVLEEDDHGLDEEDDDNDDENKEYNFFLKMFSENNELRTYYEEILRVVSSFDWFVRREKIMGRKLRVALHLFSIRLLFPRQ